MRILLIEDDQHLVWSIKTKMEQNGYAVDFESDGLVGQEMALTNNYDIIILDIMLPSINGFSICKNLRKGKIGTPILMLTARFKEGDKVRGLDSGADDYLSKPFSYPELYARIRALIRRNHNSFSSEINIGQLYIDASRKIVRFNDKDVTLTSKEYRILEYLAYNKNAIVTKEMIQAHVWGDESSIYSNVIEVFVSKLRKKLLSRKCVITTVKGLGYTIKDEKHKS